jgi:sulfoxide reductase heme-binding subunit YedZ
MDIRNTFKQHLIVGLLSAGLVSLFHYVLDTNLVVAFARTSLILLSSTLIIGPAIILKKSKTEPLSIKAPLSWRGELGIWFTVTALIHFVLFMNGFPNWSLLKALGGGIKGGGLGIANFIGLIALVWAIILSATSFNKVIRFLGSSWKWIHNFNYVIFYLVSSHMIYFQFFSTYRGGPDWFGYVSLVLVSLVVVLQVAGFIKTLTRNRRA